VRALSASHPVTKRRNTLRYCALRPYIYQTHQAFAYRVDSFENILQTNKMRSLDHSNDPYRFSFNLRLQQGVQPISRGQIGGAP